MTRNSTAMPEAVFFDWDGTLADTYNFLNDAHNHLLVELGFEQFKDGEYKKYFGMPRDILYPAIYKDKYEDAKALFEKYVFENSHKIKPLAGAGMLLDVLKDHGVIMGVVSNKKGNFISREIEHFGWGHYFSSIVGAGEALQDKPSSTPLLLALKRASLSPNMDTIWYVGDTENDLACAREAQCAGILLRGHEAPEPLIKKYNPLFFVENCTELREILVAIPQKTSKKER